MVLLYTSLLLYLINTLQITLNTLSFLYKSYFKNRYPSTRNNILQSNIY